MPPVRTTLPSVPRATTTATRVNVVGLVLLALLLQSFSPLLHARLQALAAASGLHIGVAVFCLPSQSTPPVPDAPGNGPPPSGLADCQLCQGGTAPAADLPAPASFAVPAASYPAAAPAATPAHPRPLAAAAAHRPRGPPPV